MQDVRGGRRAASRWMWALAVVAVSVPIAALAAPKIGGVGTMQHYRFRLDHAQTLNAVSGLVPTVRHGYLKNGGDDYVIGPMQILDVRNTNKAPMCFRVTVGDNGGDGQVDGDGITWWIGKRQTLHNVASVHTLQQYQCRDRECVIQMSLRLHAWAPTGKRRCN